MSSQGLNIFQTTNKGLATVYTSNTLLSREFYGLSLGLQIIFMLIFITYFGLTIFRSYKKIKNPKFKMEDPENDSEISDQEDSYEEENQKNTNDQLIYRFDQDDHEKQRKMQDVEEDLDKEQKEKEKEKQEDDETDKEEEDDDYDNEHDQHEEAFLEIDHKVLFVQPFFIGHIISNNLFACDVISITMLIATVLFFVIFNIKGVCSKMKWTTLLFMIPGILSFLPIFLNDHDMST